MSSLLGTDFVEEYRRFENVLKTNEETFFIDRENRLIYTTPFITENIITDVKDLVLEANIEPSNVNLIIDQISFISTNPNFGNYNPIKISFGNPIEDDGTGGKPQVAFGDADVYPLTDYKIIVNPRVNLETIQNRRYSNPINSLFAFELLRDEDGVPDQFVIKVYNIVQCREEVYSFFQGNDLNNWVGRVTYKSTSDYSNNIVDEELLTFQNGTYTPLKIYANDFIAVALVRLGVQFSFWDLQNDTSIAGSDFFGNLAGIELIQNNLLICDSDSDGIYNIFTKLQDGTFVNTFILPNLFPLMGDPDRVGYYTINTFVGYSNVGEFTFNRITASATTETEWNNNKITMFPVTPEAIYFGGSNVDEPVINAFVINAGFILWYRFENYEELRDNKSPSFTLKELPISPPPAFWSFSLIKRYRNTAYFVDNKFRVVLCNLDNGSVTYYSDGLDITPKLGTNVANFSRHSFIEGGKPQLFDETCVFYTIFPNDRPLDRVYKYTYQYQERTFPYFKPTKFFFNIALPNNTPISDCEIFKYIVDYRIRYTKESISKPKAVQIEGEKGKGEIDDTDLVNIAELSSSKRYKGKPPSFIRERRALGEAERILGLNLPEEFNVEDFLNIYSTS